jgi:hypothetical protein
MIRMIEFFKVLPVLELRWRRDRVLNVHTLWVHDH